MNYDMTLTEDKCLAESWGRLSLILEPGTTNARYVMARDFIDLEHKLNKLCVTLLLKRDMEKAIELALLIDHLMTTVIWDYEDPFAH